jgi:hypothetical protein
MIIPEKLNILGMIYDVNRMTNISRDHASNAQSCGNALYINIDNSLPRQVQESAFIHEIIEQINCHCEFGWSHHNICVLESVLYQIFTENKMWKEGNDDNGKV